MRIKSNISNSKYFIIKLLLLCCIGSSASATDIDTIKVKNELVEALRYMNDCSEAPIGFKMKSIFKDENDNILKSEAANLVVSKKLMISESDLVSKYIDSSHTVVVFHKPKTIQIVPTAVLKHNMQDLFSIQEGIINRAIISEYSSDENVANLVLTWNNDTEGVPGVDTIEYKLKDSRVIWMQYIFNSLRANMKNEIKIQYEDFKETPKIKPALEFVFKKNREKEKVDRYSDYLIEE